MSAFSVSDTSSDSVFIEKKQYSLGLELVTLDGQFVEKITSEKWWGILFFPLVPLVGNWGEPEAVHYDENLNVSITVCGPSPLRYLWGINLEKRKERWLSEKKLIGFNPMKTSLTLKSGKKIQPVSYRIKFITHADELPDYSLSKHFLESKIYTIPERGKFYLNFDIPSSELDGSILEIGGVYIENKPIEISHKVKILMDHGYWIYMHNNR